MPADRNPPASVSQRLRGFGRRSGLTGFAQWWFAELAPLVPRATRAAARRRRMRPALMFETDAATLWQPVAQAGEISMQPTARIPLGPDAGSAAAAGRAALDSLERRVYGGAAGAARIVIALPARQTLRRVLTLPAALEENLRQALGYDLDRHTPFKADELYFDAVVVGRDAARGEISVDLAAARRGVVDQALQQAESWGADVVAIVPDAPDALAVSRLNLLPESRRPGAEGWRRWQLWLSVFVLAAVGSVALALPLWQKRGYVIALNRVANDARTQAAVSEGLRAELDRLTGDYNFALERKFAYPSALQVLDEITKLLPDDTWLTQMEVKTMARGKEIQRELLLRGESGNAGRLIGLFEESKVFTQAAPRSPTTKFQPGPGEIFDLAAQLRPLPPPAPVALAASSESAATALPAAASVPAASPSAPSGAPATPAGAPIPAAPTASPTAATPPASGAPPSAPAVPSAPPPAPAAPGTGPLKPAPRS